MFQASSFKFQASSQAGMITPLILIIASIFIIFAVSLVSWSITGHKETVRKVKQTQSLQVAEAGVNYYKWHLAHNDSDYQDGNNWCCDEDPLKTLADCGNVCGPYVHSYKDYDNNIIGQFSLEITPPEIGSTVNTIKSTGYAYGSNSIQKKVTALVGKRSLAEYSFLSNADMSFSSTTSVSGPVHSNGEIEFNGTCSAEVTSAINVYGTGGPTSFWRFPVPIIDFSLFTVSLADIKNDAQDNGIYYGDSGAEGYLIKFLSDATVDIYRVDSLEAKVWYYNVEQGGWRKEAEEIQDKTLLGNFDMPANGLIFIEDDIWIEGTVNGKVTLAAARFPENPSEYTKIRINNNIQYLVRDGNHNLGLITQGDVLIPRYAPSNLTIDASILSQYGRGLYFRYYWPYSVKDSVENYGGIITYLRSGVKYGSPVFNGYVSSNYIYNNNLTFSPPPSFPTSENFEVLKWEEN